MSKFILSALVALPVLLAVPEAASSQQQPAPKITVAIMGFTSAAMVKAEQYAALTQGIPVVLGTELVTHPRVRLVEREQLQKVMEELQLAGTDKVDAQTAVRVGKLLNAQYLVMGGFLVDPREEMELTSRVVEVETGEIRSATRVRGKGQNIFELISKLSASLSPLLSIEAPPGQVRRGDEAAKKGDDIQGLVILTNADRERQRGNKERAIQLARNAMQVSPRLEPECRRLLAELNAL